MLAMFHAGKMGLRSNRQANEDKDLETVRHEIGMHMTHIGKMQGETRIVHSANLKIDYLRVEGDCHRLKQSLIENEIDACILNIEINPNMFLVDIPAFTSQILDLSCFLSTITSLSRLQIEFSTDCPQVVTQAFFRSFTSPSLTAFVVIRENSDGLWLPLCVETLPSLKVLVMKYSSTSEVARLLRKTSLETFCIVHCPLTPADYIAMAKELPTCHVSTLFIMNHSYEDPINTWLVQGLQYNFSITCLHALTSAECDDCDESESYVKRNVFLAEHVPDLLIGDEKEILALWPLILSKVLANGWTGISYQLLRNRMDLVCHCR